MSLFIPFLICHIKIYEQTYFTLSEFQISYNLCGMYISQGVHRFYFNHNSVFNE